MKILVAGGLRPEFKPGGAEELCARALGRALASGGHILVNGCYNAFDSMVAEAAHTTAQQRATAGDALLAIHSYVSPNVEPSHHFGKLQPLNVNSWDPGQQDWGIPEPLRECEALVVMGGGPATHRVIHLTRFVGKPILPIATFGGAAHEAYRTECERFDSLSGGRLTRDGYSILNTAIQALGEPQAFDRLAASVVSLAAKITLGNTVFVVMSFNEDADDTFGTIERVCRLYGFDPERTDKAATTERIYKRIVDGIHRAALVIADVTFESVNVYYELGFAEALGKDVIVVAKEGVKLPFDTNDIPTCFFKNQTKLEEVLRSRIGRLTGRQARSVGV